jgi:hypothetical protein
VKIPGADPLQSSGTSLDIRGWRAGIGVSVRSWSGALEESGRRIACLPDPDSRDHPSALVWSKSRGLPVASKLKRSERAVTAERSS